jgi:hypothetical protein
VLLRKSIIVSDFINELFNGFALIILGVTKSFIGPFIPDVDIVLDQITDVGVTLDEPKQFMDDGFQMNPFGGQKRKALGKVKAHLVAEKRVGAGVRPITLVCAVIKYGLA